MTPCICDFHSRDHSSNISEKTKKHQTEASIVQTTAQIVSDNVRNNGHSDEKRGERLLTVLFTLHIIHRPTVPKNYRNLTHQPFTDDYKNNNL